MTKHPLISKTVWFGFALIALDIIPELQPYLSELFPEFMTQYGLSLAGILTIFLRAATTKPLGNGE